MPRLILSVLLLAFVCLSTPALAQDCDDPTLEEIMAGQQEAMALMAPGPEHELLAGLVGDWKATVQTYMPGMDAVESSMTSSNEMILGGRFLRSVSKGSMLGMSVEAINIFGYDRRHGHYTLVGFDTLGTYYITASGHYDEATRKLTLRGTDDEPALGVTQDYAFDLAFHDEGGATVSLVFNCPTMGTGEPFEVMQYTWVQGE